MGWFSGVFASASSSPPHTSPPCPQDSHQPPAGSLTSRSRQTSPRAVAAACPPNQDTASTGSQSHCLPSASPLRLDSTLLPALLEALSPAQTAGAVSASGMSFLPAAPPLRFCQENPIKIKANTCSVIAMPLHSMLRASSQSSEQALRWAPFLVIPMYK